MSQIASLSIMMSIGLFAIIRAVLDIKKNKLHLITNVIFGGILLVAMNLLGFSTTLNYLTGSLITLYGAMGVVLIAVLKIIFKMI